MSRRDEHLPGISVARRSRGRPLTARALTRWDKVHASLKDGVLSILVPKMPEAQPKKVAIQTG